MCAFIKPRYRHRGIGSAQQAMNSSRIRRYDDLLRKSNLEFEPLDNSWISSSLEKKLLPRSRIARPRPCTPLHVPNAFEQPHEAETLERQLQSPLPCAPFDVVPLWCGLSEEVCGPVPALPTMRLR